MRRSNVQDGLFAPDKVSYIHRTPRGLSKRIVEEIAYVKKEPEWMRRVRLSAHQTFLRRKAPVWGPDIASVDFANLHYYIRPTEKVAQRWSDVPAPIRKTYDRIGIPRAERKYLMGVMAQYESEAVYHSIQEKLAQTGVIFTDMDTAVRQHPEIIQRYFGTVVPAADNKFSALNTAVWSGGSFVYVPAGVRVALPLQAYYRINAPQVGQFERTLIIAEPGSYVHYVEGCTAPRYSTSSLHSAVVEIIVKKGARVRYTTVQNWSKNVFNLVTKRSFVYEEGIMEWVDGNIGSGVTMKYPSVYLLGRKARGEVLSMACAGTGQVIDAGARAIHGAPETSSRIISKSISKGTGRTSYRGLVRIPRGMRGSASHVSCDALLLNPRARSDTYPRMEVYEPQARVGHEASVGRIGEEQLFYLQSRGLSEQEAVSMIVAGFVEPIAKELPLEYAVELNRLLEYEMSNAVG
ncbi:MAG: Fe-S cluster assembly protein SufB [Patescibacteria group bacterium]|nr:Fe-S cluster assembly protein SufB [Patescibacteria group bacterium]MDD5715742.1 Fe-S cluster assembly protein SufB [Patescibacteria group bacterium]